MPTKTQQWVDGVEIAVYDLGGLTGVQAGQYCPEEKHYCIGY